MLDELIGDEGGPVLGVFGTGDLALGIIAKLGDGAVDIDLQQCEARRDNGDDADQRRDDAASRARAALGAHRGADAHGNADAHGKNAKLVTGGVPHADPRQAPHHRAGEAAKESPAQRPAHRLVRGTTLCAHVIAPGAPARTGSAMPAHRPAGPNDPLALDWLRRSA